MQYQSAHYALSAFQRRLLGPNLYPLPPPIPHHILVQIWFEYLTLCLAQSSPISVGGVSYPTTFTSDSKSPSWVGGSLTTTLSRHLRWYANWWIAACELVWEARYMPLQTPVFWEYEKAPWEGSEE